jgi:hypothetical protein
MRAIKAEPESVQRRALSFRRLQAHTGEAPSSVFSNPLPESSPRGVRTILAPKLLGGQLFPFGQIADYRFNQSEEVPFG